MCLAIPAQVIELDETSPRLALAEIEGVRRRINVELLDGEDLRIGDYVLVHVGFAMTKIDEQQAALALEALRWAGERYDDEIDEIARSEII